MFHLPPPFISNIHGSNNCKDSLLRLSCCFELIHFFCFVCTCTRSNYSFGDYNLRNYFGCDTYVDAGKVCCSMEVLLITVTLLRKFSNRSIVIFDQLLLRYDYYSCLGCFCNCFDHFVPVWFVTSRNRY